MQDGEIITQDGEVIEQVALPQIIDTATLGAIEGAQIDRQIATAHAYPRSIKLAISNILTLATLDEQTAVECVYVIKRGGKPLRGPSIRLAEIIAQAWRNNRVEARVVQIDRVNKVIVAEGTFVDLEGNTATRASVQRRISDKYGKLFSDDMITTTGNAACSIARRNAILAGVPKGVWRRAFDEAERVIKGDVKTLVERRDQALKHMAHHGLSDTQVFAILDVKGVEDIDLEDLVNLRVIATALKNGEQTVEELLRGIAAAAPQHTVVRNPLKDEAPPDNATPADAGATAEKPTQGGSDVARATNVPPAVETVSEARRRGREARAAGHQRKAIPPEYRPADRKADADEWRMGYDETPAPAAADKTNED
jgi:hypothetical protein